MKAIAEPLEANKVKLAVEISEEEFEPAVDSAFRELARQVRIPGFRPGKVPRKVLEKRIGVEAAREQAIRDALPDFFAQAAIDTDTDAIAPPEIDITSGRDSGPVVFDAVVEVRQKVELSGYDKLKVTVPSPTPDQAEIDSHIDRLRRQNGTLAVAERPAVEGDHVKIDISGTHEGEPVSGLTADDYVYELGSAAVVAELDEQLKGASAGDTLEFDAAVPGDDEAEPLKLAVTVKEVSEMVLPDATDEWAADNSEFDTVAELRADIAERLGDMRRTQAVVAARNAVVDALADLVTDEPSEALVQLELNERLHQMQHRLEQQGLSLQQYFASSGASPEEFEAELKSAALRSAKADLALRALVDAAGCEATDDDIAEEIRKAAESAGEDPDEIRARLDHDDRIGEVRFDLSRSKAVDWLIEHSTIVDEAGDPVDKTLLTPPSQA